MKRQLLLIFLTLIISSYSYSQIFKQDFNASNVLSSYINGIPDSGQFNAVSSGNANFTTSIHNGALRFNRTGAGTMYAYRNFDFSTNPRLVELKFDFEVRNNELNKNNVFAIFIGSEFSNASAGSNSNFASRFGISTRAEAGEFRLSTIDNIGGAPSTATFSGKQTIRCIVNSTNETQTYIAPNGTNELVAAGKMDLWIGDVRGVNDFSLKNNTSPKGDISGFKFQATSRTGSGIFDFDNIEMIDLLGEAVTVPKTQSLVHPHIWVSNSDKQKILDNINQHNWAASLFNQLVQRNIDKRNNHADNPAAEINLIPNLPGDRTTHRTRLNIAAECAILYYLTEDERYAQVASDILHHYVKMISTKDATTFQVYTTNFNHLIQTREHFPRIGIIYDFVQPFLIKPTTKVYDKATNSQVTFNFNISQKAFEVLSDNVLLVGGNNSNHPVLELSGALYNVLNMEDDTTRANFFEKIMNLAGNTAQPGVNWMLDRFSQVDRLWPESSGYGKFTHAAFLQQLNVIDQYRPELNIIDNNKDLLESMFVYENFLYPNGAIMAYGDIGRNFNDHAHIFRSILAIADRKGYTALKNRAISTLQKIYRAEGGYDPKIINQRLEYRNPLQLLWGVNVDTTINGAGEPNYSTVSVKHAGVVMQRNYSGVNDEQNGLMYYTHGGTYVHTHAGGIDMELYGAGYVIGPDYGADAFGSDIHEQYAVSHAAHNTIIANGSSQRGVPNSGTWENITDEVVLQASEPKALATPMATNFSFSTQFLDDNINNLDQQRTNSIVRTSATSGYYVDVFRSTSNSTNNFHDYLFHGLGDKLLLNTKASVLPLTSTPERYKNDIGDTRKQPGWSWFTNAKTSELTNENIKARFDIEFDNKYLHLNIPGGIDKEYSTALSPPTKEVSNGYSNKDTQVFLMRKYGEAWNKPFIAVYEPSANAIATVKSTENIIVDDKVVGVKVISEVDGQEIQDIILSNDTASARLNLIDLKISFTGRFAIVRTIDKVTSTDVSLYLGEGEKLQFLDNIITGDADGKAYSEYTLGFSLSTDAIKNNLSQVISYPNPSNGKLTLSVPQSITNVSVAVYNTQLQLLKLLNKQAINGALHIDISEMPKGVYFVKVNLDTPNIVKIIKK